MSKPRDYELWAERIDDLDRTQLTVEQTNAIEAFDRAFEILKKTPSPEPSADFTRSVMARLAPRPQPQPQPQPSLRTRLLRWMHAHPFAGWQFGGAAFAAMIIGLVFVPLQPDPIGASRSGIGSMAQSAPAAGTEFVLYAPQASEVLVVGDFNGWGSAGAVKLQPAANGTWRAQIKLNPGQYQYAFVVNGKQWLADPGAMRHVDDDFGRKNSILLVM